MFAIQGLKSAWSTEKSFRSQVIAAFSMIFFMIILKPKAVWVALFSLVIAATIAAELINTALEYILDAVHPELHPAIGRAKDCAAAAVLVLSLSSLVIFVSFLIERFFS